MTSPAGETRTARPVSRRELQLDAPAADEGALPAGRLLGDAEKRREDVGRREPAREELSRIPSDRRIVPARGEPASGTEARQARIWPSQKRERYPRTDTPDFGEDLAPVERLEAARSPGAPPRAPRGRPRRPSPVRTGSAGTGAEAPSAGRTPGRETRPRRSRPGVSRGFRGGLGGPLELLPDRRSAVLGLERERPRPALAGLRERRPASRRGRRGAPRSSGRPGRASSAVEEVLLGLVELAEPEVDPAERIEVAPSSRARGRPPSG